MTDEYAYGLWPMVIINSMIIIFFALSFFRPKTKLDWRALGAFSAFVVALFTEMYGFPLTVYLLSGWLGSLYPGVDWFSHNSGHILQTLLGWSGDAHWGPLHLISNVLIVAGFILISSAWKILHEAQTSHELALTGPYAHVRHPQYSGFILIMIGFLVQWMTVATLVMFPVLLWTYLKLAKREEASALLEFGERYAEYARTTPRFIPSLSVGKKHSKPENFGLPHNRADGET